MHQDIPNRVESRFHVAVSAGYAIVAPKLLKLAASVSTFPGTGTVLALLYRTLKTNCPCTVLGRTPSRVLRQRLRSVGFTGHIAGHSKGHVMKQKPLAAAIGALCAGMVVKYGRWNCLIMANLLTIGSCVI